MLNNAPWLYGFLPIMFGSQLLGLLLWFTLLSITVALSTMIIKNHRWRDMVCLSAAALILSCLLFPIIHKVMTTTFLRFTESPWLFRVATSFFLGGLVSKALKSLHALGTYQLFFRYPPAWFSSILCGSILLGTLAIDMKEFALEFIAYSYLFTTPVLAPVLWNFFRNEMPIRSSAFAPITYEAPENQSMTTDELMAWIDEETTSDKDYFGAHVYANRIIGHLHEGKTRAIGLSGEYGSGKSTILKLVEKAFKPNPSVLLCKIDGWARTKGSIAEFILDRIVETLATRIDALSLIQMPTHYTSALKESGNGIVKIVSILAGGTRNLENVLRNLEDTLKACDLKLVLFLEDLDRNTDTRLIKEELPGLLSRLRDYKQISFVLAIGAKVKYADILMRICDYRETLAIEEGYVESLLLQFRDEMMKKYKDRSLVNPETLCQENTPYQRGGEIHIITELSILLVNPRALKFTLRKILHSWERLIGEVHFGDLFALYTLKNTAPEAFDLFCKEPKYLYSDLFKSISAMIDNKDSKENEEIRNKVEKRVLSSALDAISLPNSYYLRAWNDKLSAYGKSDPEWGERARHITSVVAVLSGKGQAIKPQQISENQDLSHFPNYLNRILRDEEIQTDKDQDAIRLFTKWQNRNEVPLNHDWFEQLANYLSKTKKKRLKWYANNFGNVTEPLLFYYSIIDYVSSSTFDTEMQKSFFCDITDAMGISPSHHYPDLIPAEQYFYRLIEERLFSNYLPLAIWGMKIGLSYNGDDQKTKYQDVTDTPSNDKLNRNIQNPRTFANRLQVVSLHYNKRPFCPDDARKSVQYLLSKSCDTFEKEAGLQLLGILTQSDVYPFSSKTGFQKDWFEHFFDTDQQKKQAVSLIKAAATYKAYDEKPAPNFSENLCSEKEEMEALVKWAADNVHIIEEYEIHGGDEMTIATQGEELKEVSN